MPFALNTVIFIPARFASTRFPGKPLAELVGATGVAKTLVQRSWEAACAVKHASAYVLTDDDRIAEVAEGFGARVLMTSTTCRNGTERCAEALALLKTEPDIVVNLQGDALLTPPDYVEALIKAMQASPSIQMATPVLSTEPEHLAQLKADRKAGRVGATTAVFDVNGDALYFSKEVLPFSDGVVDAPPVFHHIGCYAYRPAALRAYMSFAPGALETREGLEQLRFLESGIAVRCVKVEPKGRAFWEVNNPSDVPLVEAILMREGIE